MRELLAGTLLDGGKEGRNGRGEERRMETGKGNGKKSEMERV